MDNWLRTLCTPDPSLTSALVSTWRGLPFEDADFGGMLRSKEIVMTVTAPERPLEVLTEHSEYSRIHPVLEDMYVHRTVVKPALARVHKLSRLFKRTWSK